MQQAHGYGGAPPDASGGTFEFSAAQDATIGQFSSRARTWGIISMIVGALTIVVSVAVMLVGGPLGMAIGLPVISTAIAPLVSGKFYLDAGKAFGDVTTTKGNDIPAALTGVEKLKRAVQIELVGSVIGFVIGMIAGQLVTAAAEH